MQRPNEDLEALGIGAPFVDYIIEVSNEQLVQLAGSKGGMVAVDYPTLLNIIEEAGGNRSSVFFGGSGANTIKGLAHLGCRCGLIGRIGTDTAGKNFLEQMESLGVKSFLRHTETPTGQVVCLITPDQERTMRSFFGASQEMSEKDLDPAVFEGVRLVHIEGYSLLKGSLVQRAMAVAKEAGARVSFDLGSFELVHAYKPLIIDLIKYVDILFANRDEVYALTQLDPQKGCDVLKDLCEIAVVLTGPEGCWIGRHDRRMHHPAFRVEAIDSTGAGDLFASGFLYGFLQGRSLDECAYYGSLTGAAAVQVRGAEIPDERWNEIKKLLK